MTNWTPKQLDVINTRGRNILVSAAAGSGKTAVLVERIIQMISDSQNPINIDELLVVTFTKAAALEMKERVRDALESLMEKNPENKHIQRQISYINNAKIITIDSFCASVVRENFEKINIDPNFRIADEGEIELLKSDVIDEMLEEYYEEASDDFMNLVEEYSDGKLDDKIDTLIMELYNASTSHENPEKWIKECIKNYEIESVEDIENSMWMKKIKQQIVNTLKGMSQSIDEAINICESPNGPVQNREVLIQIKNHLDFASTREKYDDMVKCFDEYKMPALSRKKTECSEEKLDYVKKIKSGVSDKIKAMKESFFYEMTDEIAEEMMHSKKSVEMLIRLTLEFTQRFAQKKLEKEIMDFSDQEHYALNILAQEDENGNLVPTDTAIDMSKNFREIMIDEYQDSNSVQEAILTSISKGQGVENVFMVGDVKQSIYRFRLANPNLFLEKYNTYSEDSNSPFYKIILDRNFRSRKEIINSVNYIFESIMCRHTGGIEYKENNQLVYGADYKELPPGQDNSTEFMLIEGDREFEIEKVAKRIHQITDPENGMKVTGKEGYRRAQYSDIVILLRGLKGVAEKYVQVLESYGIPAYADTKSGFYDAMEIKTILNLLSILDNPLQDIPLAAVLLSPIFKMTEEELSEVRICNQCFYLYESIEEYIENGDNEEILNKLKYFFEKIRLWRDEIPYKSVYDIIDIILKDTGYGSYIAALGAGERRVKNVSTLKEKAAAYDKTSYKGLFNFVRYINKLQEKKKDEGEASSVSDGDNIVRIMSIHKSKGLQFPIVFLCNASSKFVNDTDNIAIHERYGIGVDYINSSLKVKQPTFIKNAIRSFKKEEDRAELLRVLYVALTRAQEKLIITGSYKSLDREIDRLNAEAKRFNVQAEYTDIVDSNNFMSLMGSVIAKNKAFEDISDCACGENPLYNADADIRTFKYVQEDILEKVEDELFFNERLKEKRVLKSIDGSQVFNEQVKKMLDNNLSWKYPYIADIGISTKASVTEIKKNSYVHYDEQQDGKQIYEEEEISEIIPEFARNNDEKKVRLTGAERGTAYHRIFELMDMHMQSYTKDTVRQMIDGFLEKNLIDEMTAQAVNEWDIIKFTNTELFKRMRAADERGELYRERKFLMGRRAGELNENSDSDEMVIIQGIIDACFIEDGKYVLLDYKTDNVKEMKELYERYHVQLDCYEEALKQVAGTDVSEKIIYSVKLGECYNV